jgi:hypothetical protein
VAPIRTAVGGYVEVGEELASSPLPVSVIPSTVDSHQADDRLRLFLPTLQVGPEVGAAGDDTNRAALRCAFPSEDPARFVERRGTSERERR